MSTDSARRITVEEVVAAAARHPDVRPSRCCRCLRFTGEGGVDWCACPAALLAIDAGARPETIRTSGDIASALGTDVAYVEGFERGVDGYWASPLGDSRHWDGCKDGRAVNAAIFNGEGP